MTESIAWETTGGPDLRQGEILKGCYVPIMPADFGSEPKLYEVNCVVRDLIVLTQSCDLEDLRDDDSIALCKVFSTKEFETADPRFKKRGEWDQVRKGRYEGLFLLDPLPDGLSALVVDFREIVSLPQQYIRRRALELGQRWRLKSPFREKFSHKFGDFYSRVAT